MMKRLLGLATAFLLVVSPAWAGIIYADNAGNAAYSGSTDTASPTISGSTATVSGATVILDAGTVLTALNCVDGSATQSAIFLTSASNSNQKIFWCTSSSGSGGATPTLGLSVTPTCAANACGAWNVGGRHLAVMADAALEATIRSGDILQYNNDVATANAVGFTCRTANATGVPAIIRGKAGVYPKLEATGTTNVIACAQNNYIFQGLTIRGDGASGVAMALTGNNIEVIDNKFTRAGGTCITDGQTLIAILNDITGCLGDGINLTSSQHSLFANYIHAVGGDCAEDSATTPSLVAEFNIFSLCGARGLYLSGSPGSPATQLARIVNNTFYKSVNSGLEIVSANTPFILFNNLFLDNATTSGANILGGAALTYGPYGYNIIFQSGGNTNVTNYTLASTDLAVNPGLTNPASGDFTLTSSSAARGTGTPGTLLNSSTGYLSIGAIQPALTGGGHIIGG
jgi:hypothetical protein